MSDLQVDDDLDNDPLWLGLQSSLAKDKEKNNAANADLDNDPLWLGLQSSLKEKPIQAVFDEQSGETFGLPLGLANQDVANYIDKPKQSRSFFDTIFSVPKTVASGLEASVRGKDQTLQEAGLLKNISYYEDLAKDGLNMKAIISESMFSPVLQGFVFGGAEEGKAEAGKRAEQLKSQLDVLRYQYSRTVERSKLQRPEGGLGVVFDVSAGLADAGIVLGMTALTRNPTYAALTMGKVQESSAYVEAIGNDVPEDKARATAVLSGVLSAAVNFAGGQYVAGLYSAAGNTMVKKIGFSAVEEKVRSFADSATAEVIMQNFGGREKSIEQTVNDVLYNTVIGFVAGVTVATPVVYLDTYIRGTKPNIPDDVRAKIVEELAPIMEAKIEAAQDAVGDLASISNAPSKEAVDNFVEIVRQFEAGESIDVRAYIEQASDLTTQQKEALLENYNEITDTKVVEIERALEPFEAAMIERNDERITEPSPIPQAQRFELGEFVAGRYRDYTKLKPEMRLHVKGMVKELKESQTGFLLFTDNERGAGQTVTGYKSTFPAWFQGMAKQFVEDNKERAKIVKKNRLRDMGDQIELPPSKPFVTRKKFAAVVNKMLEDKPLGKGEAVFAEAIYDAALDWRMENARQMLEARSNRVFDADNATDAQIEADGGQVFESERPLYRDAVVQKPINVFEEIEVRNEGARPKSRAEIEDIVYATFGEQVMVAKKDPVLTDLENDERLKNRVAEIIKVKENEYGLISGNLLSRNLERLTQNDFIEDFTLGIGKAIAPLSTRVKNISTKLFARLREYEFYTKEQIMLDTENVTPFLRKYRKLENDTQLAMDLALKNGDVELINYLAKTNDMVAEIQSVQKVLDDIYARAQDAGVNVEYRKNYFPRRVKDVDGLVDYFKRGEYWSTIEKAFKNWADKNVPLTQEGIDKLNAYRAKITEEIKGGVKRKLTAEERSKVSELYFEKKDSLPRRALTQEEKAKIINSLVRGFSVGGISIARSGSLKKSRTIESVTADINKFYENTEKTLLAYLTGVNETIETSKLFGKGRIIEGEGQLNVEESVGAFIEEAVANQQISNRDLEILKEAFTARFNPKAMGWIVGSIRDLTYVDVMGSPLNAITQFGDLAVSMYNAGVWNALTTVTGAARDRTKVTLRDITVENIAQEFDNNSLTSDAVNKVFQLIGLNKIDRIGKLTLVNATLKKMQKQARKGDKALAEQLNMYFEDDARQVMQNLKDGVITQDVKFLLFNTLADFQPITRSEMPQYYNSGGNLKILYMLKSFTTKQLDVYRREVFTKLNDARKTGDAKLAAQALTNLIRLAGYWIVMGASADYMKDMLRSAFGGDEMEEPEDYVIDNMFKAFGWSRFQQDMIARDGLSETFFKLFIPPTKLIDNLERDSKTFQREGLTLDNSRTIRSMPVGGELYYFWFGAAPNN